MERLGRALCRTDHPREDAAMMRRCADAWPAALDAMRTASGATPAEVARLFDGLCRWRAHRSWWTPKSERRAATHYLIEAAARLALMDYVHGADDDAAPRRAAECLDVCAVALAQAEAATIREPFDAVRAEHMPELLMSITTGWREPESAHRERSALAPIAHALLVSADSGAASTVAHTDLLVRAARVSTLCAAREILRAITVRRAAITAAPVDQTAVAAIRAWVCFRAAGTHSEAAAKAYTDALVADRLDPSRLPAEEATASPSATSTNAQVSVLLAMQDPTTALCASDGAKGGAATLASREGRDETVLTFALFDHAAYQLHGTRWAAAYTATDARPEAALARVRRYAAERMVKPPPLLLLLDQQVFALRRREGGEGIAGVTVHATGAEALAVWVADAGPHPAVGPRYSGVIRSALAGAPEGVASTSMALPLVPA